MNPLSLWCCFLFLYVFGLGDTNFGIVIDAGSSGTRLYVYSWDILNIEYEDKE
jgi:hypothetical protein